MAKSRQSRSAKSLVFLRLNSKQAMLANFRRLIYLVLFLLPIQAYTQQDNPFEIRQSIPKELGAKGDSTTPLIIDQSNPFEIIQVPEGYVPRDTLVIRKPVPITSTLADNQNFLFVALIILLLLLTILITLNRGLLANIYKAIFSDTYLKLVYRIQHSSQMLSYILLYLFFFLNTGLFLFLVLKYLKINPLKNDILLYLACVGVIISMFLTKHIVVALIGQIFPVKKEASYYNFMIIAFNIFFGIAMLPLNGLISFTGQNVAYTCLVIGVLAILMYAIRQFRAMLMAGNFISDQKFHFFVYLCTVEIAPILIIARIIMSYADK